MYTRLGMQMIPQELPPVQGSEHGGTNMARLGPSFGYHPNALKTYLVVKQNYEEVVRQIFSDTDVCITTQVKRHLGAALGSKTFTEEYVSDKV